MNHTKEPWECDGMAVFCGDTDIALCAHYDKPLEQAQSDASRIVACVNACAGIADPSVIPDAIRDLQMLVKWAWEHLRKGEDGFMLERIEKTLAKLKGGA